MALRHVILGLLADRPDHGYALKRRLSPGLPPEALVNDGVLYPLLAKLEDEGLVAHREEPGRAGRPRRVFRATAKGRRAFAAWLRSDEDEGRPPGYDLYAAHPLVKLLFAAHLSEDELRAKLTAHAEQARERLAVLERLRTLLPAEDLQAELNGGWLALEAEHLERQAAWLSGLAARAPRGPATTPRRGRRPAEGGR